MKQRLIVALSATALAALALTGCSAAHASNSTGTSSAASSHPTASSILTTGSSTLGTITTAADGRTVYVFTQDTRNSGKSTCYNACADAWPPVTVTSSKPKVTGLTGTIGTITRTDGAKQITVNGMPLYLFAQDSNTGDVNGQGLMQAWYVVSPAGKPITAMATTSAPTTTPTAPATSAAPTTSTSDGYSSDSSWG